MNICEHTGIGLRVILYGQMKHPSVWASLAVVVRNRYWLHLDICPGIRVRSCGLLEDVCSVIVQLVFASFAPVYTHREY